MSELKKETSDSSSSSSLTNSISSTVEQTLTPESSPAQPLSSPIPAEVEELAPCEFLASLRGKQGKNTEKSGLQENEFHQVLRIFQKLKIDLKNTLEKIKNQPVEENFQEFLQLCYEHDLFLASNEPDNKEKKRNFLFNPNTTPILDFAIKQLRFYLLDLYIFEENDKDKEIANQTKHQITLSITAFTRHYLDQIQHKEKHPIATTGEYKNNLSETSLFLMETKKRIDDYNHLSQEAAKFIRTNPCTYLHNSKFAYLDLLTYFQKINLLDKFSKNPNELEMNTILKKITTKINLLLISSTSEYDEKETILAELIKIIGDYKTLYIRFKEEFNLLDTHTHLIHDLLEYRKIISSSLNRVESNPADPLAISKIRHEEQTELSKLLSVLHRKNIISRDNAKNTDIEAISLLKEQFFEKQRSINSPVLQHVYSLIITILKNYLSLMTSEQESIKNDLNKIKDTYFNKEPTELNQKISEINLGIPKIKEIIVVRIFLEIFKDSNLINFIKNPEQLNKNYNFDDDSIDSLVEFKSVLLAISNAINSTKSNQYTDLSISIGYIMEIIEELEKISAEDRSLISSLSHELSSTLENYSSLEPDFHEEHKITTAKKTDESNSNILSSSSSVTSSNSSLLLVSPTQPYSNNIIKQATHLPSPKPALKLLTRADITSNINLVNGITEKAIQLSNFCEQLDQTTLNTDTHLSAINEKLDTISNLCTKAGIIQMPEASGSRLQNIFTHFLSLCKLSNIELPDIKTINSLNMEEYIHTSFSKFDNALEQYITSQNFDADKARAIINLKNRYFLIQKTHIPYFDLEAIKKIALQYYNDIAVIPGMKSFSSYELLEQNLPTITTSTTDKPVKRSLNEITSLVAVVSNLTSAIKSIENNFYKHAETSAVALLSNYLDSFTSTPFVPEEEKYPTTATFSSPPPEEEKSIVPPIVPPPSNTPSSFTSSNIISTPTPPYVSQSTLPASPPKIKAPQEKKSYPVSKEIEDISKKYKILRDFINDPIMPASNQTMRQSLWHYYFNDFLQACVTANIDLREFISTFTKNTNSTNFELYLNTLLEPIYSDEKLRSNNTTIEDKALNCADALFSACQKANIIIEKPEKYPDISGMISALNKILKEADNDPDDDQEENLEPVKLLKMNLSKLIELKDSLTEMLRTIFDSFSQITEKNALNKTYPTVSLVIDSPTKSPPPYTPLITKTTIPKASGIITSNEKRKQIYAEFKNHFSDPRQLSPLNKTPPPTQAMLIEVFNKAINLRDEHTTQKLYFELSEHFKKLDEMQEAPQNPTIPKQGSFFSRLFNKPDNTSTSKLNTFHQKILQYAEGQNPGNNNAAFWIIEHLEPKKASKIQRSDDSGETETLSFLIMPEETPGDIDTQLEHAKILENKLKTLPNTNTTSSQPSSDVAIAYDKIKENIHRCNEILKLRPLDFKIDVLKHSIIQEDINVASQIYDDLEMNRQVSTLDYKNPSNSSYPLTKWRQQYQQSSQPNAWKNDILQFAQQYPGNPAADEIIRKIELSPTETQPPKTPTSRHHRYGHPQTPSITNSSNDPKSPTSTLNSR